MSNQVVVYQRSAAEAAVVDTVLALFDQAAEPSCLDDPHLLIWDTAKAMKAAGIDPEPDGYRCPNGDHRFATSVMRETSDGFWRVRVCCDECRMGVWEGWI